MVTISNLRYVGRNPDSDSTVANKAYADADNAAVAVTTGFIDQQVANQGHDLVGSAYVDQQVANYTTQSAVNSALGAYVPNTALSAVSGVAQGDTTGLAQVGQLPTLTTDRVARSYNIATVGTNYLGGGTHTVTTTNLGEYVIASIPVSDPGYPWFPLPFAYISGQAGGTPSGSRFSGNGNVGFLAVIPPSGVSNTIYASGLCTDDPITNWYQALPHGSALNTVNPASPTNTPPILGPLTLNLTACCWSGNGYAFNGSNLVYHITVMPAIGNGALPH